MNPNFYEQTCPFCKTQFKEGDDIVICSICEMPHHKDCWIENKGCTTFGCTGTIKGAAIDNYSNIMNNACAETRDFYFCTSCGAKNLASANFCGSCGNKLFKPDVIENVQQSQCPTVNVMQKNSNFYTDEPDINSNQYDPGMYDDYELVNQFVRDNKVVYIQKFRRLHSKKTSVSWNWCVCLFDFYWFAYRKMYLYSAILFFVNILFLLMGNFGIFLNIILFIAVAVFADKIYFNFINKKIAAVKDTSQEVKNNFCVYNGGTSKFSCLVIIFLWVLVSTVIAIIRA